MRAVSNLIEAIGDAVQFKVVTRDRDFGDEEPFTNIRSGSWQQVGKADVLYLPVKDLSFWKLDELLEDSPAAPIFLNSLFSPVTLRVLILNKLAGRRRRTVVLAPRGECAESALVQKRTKKSVYLAVAAFFNLYDDLIWLSSSAHETQDIARMWERLLVHGELQQCPELPTTAQADIAVTTEKQTGTLQAAFLGRIVPVKNLPGALAMLQGAAGDITLNIFGPKEDLAYWKECEAEFEKLAPNIRVIFSGPVPHEDVARVLSQQDILFAPSFGENYGHSIIEALTVGCPVITSDQTPWRGLAAAGAGWDLDLDDLAGARAAVARMVAMGPAEHGAMRERAKLYAETQTDYAGITQTNLNFFTSLPVTA